MENIAMPSSLDVGFSAASTESQFKLDTFAGISLKHSHSRSDYQDTKVNGNWNALFRHHPQTSNFEMLLKEPGSAIANIESTTSLSRSSSFGYDLSELKAFEAYSSPMCQETKFPTTISVPKSSEQQQFKAKDSHPPSHHSWIPIEVHSNNMMDAQHHGTDFLAKVRSDSDSVGSGDPSAVREGQQSNHHSLIGAIQEDFARTPSPPRNKKHLDIFGGLDGIRGAHLGLLNLEQKQHQNNSVLDRFDGSRYQTGFAGSGAVGQTKQNSSKSRSNHPSNQQPHTEVFQSQDNLQKPLQTLNLNANAKQKRPGASGSISLSSGLNAPMSTIGNHLINDLPSPNLVQQTIQPAKFGPLNGSKRGQPPPLVRPRAETYPPVTCSPDNPQDNRGTQSSQSAPPAFANQLQNPHNLPRPASTPAVVSTGGPGPQIPSPPPPQNMKCIQPLLMPGAPQLHVTSAAALPQRVFLQECIGPNGKVMYTLVPEHNPVNNTPAFFLAQPPYTSMGNGNSPHTSQQMQQNNDPRYFYPSASAPCQQSPSQHEMPMFTTVADNNNQDPRFCQPKDHYIMRVPVNQIEPRNLVFQSDPRLMIHQDPPTAVRARDGSFLLYSSPQPLTVVQNQDFREKNVRCKKAQMQPGSHPHEMKVHSPVNSPHQDQRCSPLPPSPLMPVAEHLSNRGLDGASPLHTNPSPMPPISTTMTQLRLADWDLDRELPPSHQGARDTRERRDRPPRNRSVSICHNGGNLLEEFRASIGKGGRRWELSDLRQNAVQFCRDQHGSRFIQQQFEVASKHEKQLLFDEILPHAFSLMTDVFGNYVIQKLFDYGTTDQREEMAALLIGNAVQLSLQMYGCRVVQKALEYVSITKLLVLVAEFQGHVMKCVQDQNGNHVIQKCIEVASRAAQQQGILPNGDTLHSRIQFIIDAFVGQTERLSTHAYGCRVIQRILEHCVNSQKLVILREIESSFTRLVKDQYGNYVIQHILRYGRPSDRAMLMEAVKGNLLTYSQHKFASNVVEKCLQFGSYEERAQIILRLFQYSSNSRESLLQQMVCDPYANYVVQKIIDVADEDQRNRIVNELRAQSAQLKRYTFGKHIISRLEKLHSKRI